jgi:uncharacterized Fe-S cluster-containing protein
MDEVKFNEAKSLQENIDKLKRREKQLKDALKSSSISAVLTYYTTGSFFKKSEVSLSNKEGLHDIINKELSSIILGIADLEKEFKNL